MFLKNRRLGVFLSIFLAFSSAAVFALPGISPVVPDSSGEYVFYLDKSFQRTSYIGFLYYDDGTYALRYYAPMDAKKALFEKDITLYVTVDPEQDHLELTGETITGTNDVGDTDIINYLHDLFYEFTARRQKADVSEKTVVDQEFEQFGGLVRVTFDPLVPLFNIQEISAANGTKLFTLQTTGILVSSSDTSFVSFKGFIPMPKDKDRSLPKQKKTQAVKAVCDGMTVTLDTLWEQKLENLWSITDNALLVMGSITPPPAYDTDNSEKLLLRWLSQFSDKSYPVISEQRIKRDKNFIRIENLCVQGDSGTVIRDIKILYEKDGRYSVLTLTVYDGTWRKNKKYFEKILASCKMD